MDQIKLEEKIAYYYSRLSPSAREVFSKMEWLQKLQALSSTYALSNEQAQTLGTETTLALLGILHLDEFEKNLEQDLHLPKLTFEKILIEVNKTIINPIREELAGAYESNVIENTPEKIKLDSNLDERFAGADRKTREMLLDINYYELVYEIAQENTLNVTQIGEFEECVTNAILGEEDPAKLQDTIRERVGVDEEVAKKLTLSVNEKILKVVRGKMMEDNSPEEGEDQILEEAGIKIVGEGEALPAKVPPPAQNPPQGKVDLTTPELPAPKVESVAKPSTPVLSQKFAGTFKMDSKKSEHGAIPPINSYPKGADPYREQPQ